MIGMLIDRADLPKRFADIGELESFMARPTQELIDDLAAVPGDILVLGAGGKMGPTFNVGSACRSRQTRRRCRPVQ